MAGWRRKKGIRLEPSALAGMAGSPARVASVSYQQMHGFSAEQLRNATASGVGDARWNGAEARDESITGKGR